MSDNLHQALERFCSEIAEYANDQRDDTSTSVGIRVAAGLIGDQLETILAQHPEPETTTEWGARALVGPDDICIYEDEETARIFTEDDEELVTREVGAWKKADQ